jgi:hypothetical protein
MKPELRKINKKLIEFETKLLKCTLKIINVSQGIS